jgi:membrane protease YdiL (CAAX protease family)
MIDKQSITPLKKLWRLALYIGFGILSSLALSTALMPFLYDVQLGTYFIELQQGEADWLPQASRLLAAFQQICTFLIPGLIFYYLHHIETKQRYTQKIFLYVVALNILSIPLVELAFYVNQFFPAEWLTNDFGTNELFIQQILTGEGYAVQIANIAILCVLPAIGEELVFRFGLQKHILSKTSLGPAGAIILTSFVFSFIHFDASGFLPRFVLALILGASYYYSRTLLVPILFHLFNNYMAYLQMKFGEQDGLIPEYYYQNTWLTVGIVGICMLLLIKTLKYMNASETKPYE